MDWQSILNATVDYIENNLTQEINVSDVAKSVYVSPYFLVSAVHSITFAIYLLLYKIASTKLSLSKNSKSSIFSPVPA